MKIFRIQLEKFAGYDSYQGHVIVSENEESTLSMAKQVSADEGKEIWDTAKIEEIGEYTGNNALAFVLLSDFNAG